MSSRAGRIEGSDERSDRKDRYARARGLVGAFRDREDAADVAEEHDRYLDAAFDSLTTVDEGR
ncbi:MAG TPA: hypothetical protein VEY33_15200 [Gemmatimonadota bacterium]|nr:hypothetical protein [Gemmatimonadota bacterium]